MKKPMLVTTIIVLLLFCVVGLGISQRHILMVEVMTMTGGEPPPLLDATGESPGTVWFDDYFTIEEIVPGTWAIGEPRYPQQNFNYLIIGHERALLFDAGPGVRNILPVAESLTDLPIIFLPSHFHYDHVGNGVNFQQRAVVDLPYLRARTQGDQLTFTDMEHLGSVEGFPLPTWKVDHWWAPGDKIELGGRDLIVIHTPGHSPESISLWDSANNLILSGDYLYTGPLYAFVPGSSLKDYLSTADQLLSRFDQATVYFGAHRISPPGPPELNYEDLSDLKTALEQIKNGKLEGEGLWPVIYPVNQRITLLADPGFLQDWE
jgi:hydroxyacylglutathione hydrolase